MDDPNKLVRRAAGSYRTADDRFEVRGEPNRWFLVDTEQADELGQELIRGPFATLDDVREAIPDARRAQIKALPAAKPGKAAGRRKSRPAHPSWIDRLPAGDAPRVRALINALEREGIAKAEQLVRRDREGMAPEVARTLISRRLDELVAEWPTNDRQAARELVARVAEVLTGEGARRRGELPGWLLIEIGREPEPPNRRITLGDD